MTKPKLQKGDFVVILREVKRPIITAFGSTPAYGWVPSMNMYKGQTAEIDETRHDKHSFILKGQAYVYHESWLRKATEQEKLIYLLDKSMKGGEND